MCGVGGGGGGGGGQKVELLTNLLQIYDTNAYINMNKDIHE